MIRLLNYCIPSFILTLTSLFFAVIFLLFESILANSKLKYDIPTNLVIVFFIFSLFLILKFLNIWDTLRRQRIHNQHSWIFYIYFGFFLGFSTELTIYIYTKIWPSLNYIWPLSLIQPLNLVSDIQSHLNWINRFFVYFIAIACYFLIIKPKEINYKEWQFAPGSIGLNEDELDFKKSAYNIAKALNKNRDYVEVSVIYGDAGEGKSSFTRQIVESLDPTKILYTYISLTETNEAKDFSSLFSERWLESIKERYPKLNTISALNVMRIITRETNHGFIMDILYFLSSLNIPILQTQSKIQDKSTVNKDFTSKDIAKVFGNVTRIEENFWIIVVDEIERAKLDEIYRLIEVIERFKYEGRSGLPVRLIFLLCIARQDLFFNLDKQDNEHHPNELSRLIKNFILDAKNITDQISLPPVEYGIKEKFIISRLLSINDQFNIEHELTEQVLKPLATYRLIDFTKFPDERATMHAIITMLVEESPRIINRVIEGIKSFYSRFTDAEGKPITKMIAYCDIVTLTYISVKYPYIIDFYKKTIDDLLPHEEPTFVNDRMIASYESNKDGAKKRNLIDWVMKKVGVNLDDEDLSSRIGILITMSAFLYLKRSKYDYQDPDKLKYINRSSLPENLYAYLYLSEPYKTTFIRDNQIYNRHKEDINFIQSLNNEELLNYSKFLRYYVSGKEIVHLRISWLKEVLTRFVGNRIKLVPRHINGGTIGETFTYEFIFQALWSFETLITDSQDYTFVFNLVCTLLKSKRIPIYFKYIILSTLLNSDNKDGDIHFRFSKAFERMPHTFRVSLIKIAEKIMNELFENYEGKTSIYSREENFLYVLYQSGSGDLNNISRLKRIYKVAENGLEKYPDVLEIYWERLPYKDGDKTVTDAWSAPFFHSSGVIFYLPLERLISITKKSPIYKKIKAKVDFWESRIKIPEEKNKYEELSLKGEGISITTLYTDLRKKSYINY